MRLVAKIGTSSITTDDGAIDEAAIAKLADEVAAVRQSDHEVILVSSGAVAAGVGALGYERRPTDILTLQAVSAVGQSRLIGRYNHYFGDHGIVGAQVLVDPFDFVDRGQYLHARATLDRLLDLGCVPILNENDAIASDELRYGDNDRIAALIAHATKADLLILLTDADGLFTGDPRSDPDATMIEHVAADDPLLSISTAGGGSGRGSGGMASKLAAARIASWSGVETVIARAAEPDVVPRVVAGDRIGTRFDGSDRRLSAKRLWIAFASEVRGAVVVDDGARSALTASSRSLLPAGVKAVVGEFPAGATIDVVDSSGAVFARGRVSAGSTDISGVIGLRTDQLPDEMIDEVIHRDDLVLLPE